MISYVVRHPLLQIWPSLTITRQHTTAKQKLLFLLPNSYKHKADIPARHPAGTHTAACAGAIQSSSASTTAPDVGDGEAPHAQDQELDWPTLSSPSAL